MTSPPYIFTRQNLSDTHHWVSTTNLASNESSVIAKKVFGNWSQGVLTPERQLEIGRWFGKIESTFYNHPKSPHRDIFRVSNDEAEGWVTAVWPDLAKNCHLGKILKRFGHFLSNYIVLGKIVSLLCQIFYTFGQISIVLKVNYWKNNLDTLWVRRRDKQNKTNDSRFKKL